MEYNSQYKAKYRTKYKDYQILQDDTFLMEIKEQKNTSNIIILYETVTNTIKHQPGTITSDALKKLLNYLNTELKNYSYHLLIELYMALNQILEAVEKNRLKDWGIPLLVLASIPSNQKETKTDTFLKNDTFFTRNFPIEMRMFNNDQPLISETDVFHCIKK
ncbi:5215_t:CDS:2, partial [Funneliformis geosporum]